jgi:hypothetical protein
MQHIQGQTQVPSQIHGETQAPHKISWAIRLPTKNKRSMTGPSKIHGECKLRQNHAGLRWVAYTNSHTQNRIHNKKPSDIKGYIYIYMVPSKIKEWIQLLHKINEHLKLSFEHPRECKSFIEIKRIMHGSYELVEHVTSCQNSTIKGTTTSC